MFGSLQKERNYMQKIIIYSSSLCMQALLEGLLYDCGAEVCVATSRQNLFERCAAERFDKVVVGDISLFVEGCDTVERLRLCGVREPQILVFAPDITEECVVSLLESGVNQYVSLPAAPTRLRRKVFGV